MNQGGRFTRTPDGELIPIPEDAAPTPVPDDPPAEIPTDDED